MKQKAEIILEVEETIILRQGGCKLQAFCPQCQALVEMVTPPIAASTSLQRKKEGVIRIGTAKPNVITPDSKNDASAGAEIAGAVSKFLIESLSAEKIETVELSSAAPEAEAKVKLCEYIFYANVTQKRGGGGMFGKMLAMRALCTAGGMIPGVGGISVAGSVIMSQMMGKTAKAKDEFTFDYKIAALDNTVLAQAATKAKAQKDGEDVLSPQIKQASVAILGEITRKKIGG